MKNIPMDNITEQNKYGLKLVSPKETQQKLKNKQTNKLDGKLSLKDK